MSIVYDSQNRVYFLHTQDTTYQIQVDSYNHLLHLYYGRRNPFANRQALLNTEHGFSPNPDYVAHDELLSLDLLPQEYPSTGTGDFRSQALRVIDEKGAYHAKLFFRSSKIYWKEPHFTLPALYKDGTQVLEITLEDPVSHLQAILYYTVFEKENLITRKVILKNEGEQNLVLDRALSMSLDFLDGAFDQIVFWGRHNMERQMQRKSVDHGRFTISSSRGTSSHHYNPSIILCRENTDEDHGDCYGFAFNYSGNFLIEVEKDPYDQVRVLMGIDDDLFSYPLEPGKKLELPEAILSYSHKGLSVLSHQFHSILDFYGAAAGRRGRKPVWLNSWEAFYFDFDHDSFIELAKEAKDLGIDGIVLDDGWFGKRNDDTNSLGDWYANEEKLGGSLKKLSDEIHNMGLKFGLWMEPEMISEDSQLYKEHPEWVVSIDGRKPMPSRNQLVLDLSNKDVINYLDSVITRVIRENKVDYLKWDMNRSLTDIPKGTLFYDYYKGLYALLNRISRRFPNLLIEGCSGGGGRFDFGMLKNAYQIWASDNTDAINRALIQYGTSFFYPMHVQSAHVSASPNHQTGRHTPLETRGDVALQGALGYELDLRTLSKEEKEEIKRQIALYKQIDPLIQKGLFYRLSNPFKDRVAAWQFVSRDKKKVLLSGVVLETAASGPVYYVKAKDLKEEARYRDVATGEIYGGAQLMYGGLPLYPTKQHQSFHFLLEQVL